MKLFDLNKEEGRALRRLAVWHLVYLALIALFFWIIYYFGFYKAYGLLRDKPIFMVMAPICTIIFIIASPWRRHWLMAVKDTYDRLEGESAFCFMAALVFLMGFYFYSVLLWGLGALGPTLYYWNLLGR